ncbi:MAG TPA: sialidase, partial [Acidobacteriota bacterium]|nr:sialidase [Acidobacteriota bacterium]
MRQALLISAVIAILFPVILPAASTGSVPAARFDAGTISGLGIRNIGPARVSGRVSALTAVNKDGKTLIYLGAASGGVWKSEDGGTTFKPVFDKNPVQSIGAVALDPSNSDTVWVGTGESWTRNSVSIGDGIYKSTDGGETWANVGLKESERISKILIDPKNSNIVYVCAPGKLWSDSAERGVYKTEDGGKTWSQVLKGGNLSTGCSGLTMDPQNSQVLFAGLWDFRRQAWTFRSGGNGPDQPSGSGLFRSTDSGKTWSELKAGADGLPPKPYGRIAVEFAPSNNRIVYAFIEGVDSALYRSDDGGKTWDKRD